MPGGSVYIYRLGSLTLATITAVILLGLCISSTKTFHQSVDDGLGDLAHNYANVGIASGAMVILTFPIMVFVDFINDGKIGLPILIEVPWLCVVWVMFIATGISAKNFAHGFVHPGYTCDDFVFEEGKKICRELEPIEIVSWITAGLAFLYSVTLLLISVKKANAGNSVWGNSVKNSEI